MTYSRRERNEAQGPGRTPMSQKHRHSIVENEEAMEAPAPHLIRHRKNFAAFERAITGGRHIGHLPVYEVAIEGWTFCRCRREK